MSTISPAVLAELAPAAKLRAAILRTSPVLVAAGAPNGTLSGIAADLALELGTRIGLPVELIAYETTAALVEDLRHKSAWDIGFFSYDPDHTGVSFTAPYLECEGTYLVKQDSPVHAITDVDRDGVRVAVSARSSLDLHLSRHLEHARLVRIPGATAAAACFLAGDSDALAGIKQQLYKVAARLPGARLLDGKFMVIRHALASPAGREAAARYLYQFVEDAKISGFIAHLIGKHAIRGALVAATQSLR